MATLQRWFYGLAQGAINFEGDPARQKIGDAVSAEISAIAAPIFDRLERAPDGSALSHMLHDGMAPGTTRPREQMIIALKVLLERTTDIALVPGKEPVFRGWEFRAPTSLNVTLAAA